MGSNVWLKLLIWKIFKNTLNNYFKVLSVQILRGLHWNCFQQQNYITMDHLQVFILKIGNALSIAQVPFEPQLLSLSLLKMSPLPWRNWLRVFFFPRNTSQSLVFIEKVSKLGILVNLFLQISVIHLLVRESFLQKTSK